MVRGGLAATALALAGCLTAYESGHVLCNPDHSCVNGWYCHPDDNLCYSTQETTLSSSGSTASASSSTGVSSGTSTSATTGATSGATTGATSGAASGTTIGSGVTTTTTTTTSSGGTTGSSCQSLASSCDDNHPCCVGLACNAPSGTCVVQSTSSSSGGTLRQLTSIQNGTATILRQYNDEIWVGQNWADDDEIWTGAGGLYLLSDGVWSDQTPGLLSAGAMFHTTAAIDLVTADTNPGTGAAYYTYAHSTDGTLYFRQEPSGSWGVTQYSPLPAVGSMCALGGTVALLGGGSLSTFTPATLAWTTAATTLDGIFSQTGDCWVYSGTGIYQVTLDAGGVAVSPAAPTCGGVVTAYDAVDDQGAHTYHLQPGDFSTAVSDDEPLASPSPIAGAFTGLSAPGFMWRGELAHDATYEYAASGAWVQRVQLNATPNICTTTNGGQTEQLPDFQLVNGLGRLSSDSLLWVGTDRGLYTVTFPAATGVAVDAGFPGFAFIDAAQGGSKLFLLGNDELVYEAAGGVVVPFSGQGFNTGNAPRSHAIAASGDDFVAATIVYANLSSFVDYLTPAGSFGGGNNPEYFGNGPYRSVAYSPEPNTVIVYAYQDTRISPWLSTAPSLEVVQLDGGIPVPLGWRLPDAGTHDGYAIEAIAPAGDAGVYFLCLSLNLAEFSVDGINLGALSFTLPSSGFAIVSAAALPPPGAVALVTNDGQGYWLCTPTGSPPTALDCTQQASAVSGVTSVAYDAAGTLWFTATDGLHTGDGTLAAASTEPLRLVATVPGESGVGAIYVTGIAHSFLYQ